MSRRAERAHITHSFHSADTPPILAARQAQRDTVEFRRVSLEVEGGPKRPHRSPVPGNQPIDEPLVFFVAVAVEEGESVVAVYADVPAREQLETSARLSANLCVGVVCIGGVVDQADRPAVPARPAQQVWSRAAAAEAQQERGLYGGLGDFEVQGFRRLR